MVENDFLFSTNCLESNNTKISYQNRASQREPRQPASRSDKVLEGLSLSFCPKITQNFGRNKIMSVSPNKSRAKEAAAILIIYKSDASHPENKNKVLGLNLSNYIRSMQTLEMCLDQDLDRRNKAILNTFSCLVSKY